MARTPKPLVVASILAVLVLGAVGAWLAWPDPPPPPTPDESADDTGMTRQQTEDLMRTIGYVQ